MKRNGFTLIELLIVTAVFSLAALVATTVITRIQSTQRGILGRQRVVADGRYVLETIARAVRQGSINYSYYNSSLPNGQQTTLALIDQTNIETCYRFGDPSPATPTKVQVMSGSNVSGCSNGTPDVWTDITPADLVVTDFHVYITPHSDPFRPVPRQPGDCRTAAGFDASRSVCACAVATSATDCFADQACVSGDINAHSRPEGEQCGFSETGCLCQNANRQPQVTIYLSTRSSNQASGESASSTMQTTVTSHLYRR